MGIAAEAAALFDENRHDDLFSLAERNWKKRGEALPDGVAEACRYASIRAWQLGRADAEVWRARAWSAAILTGSRSSAAGLLIQQVMAAIGRAREDEASGGYEAARQILEEIPRLVPEGSDEWKRLYERLYHEKRGFSFLMEAARAAASSETSRRNLLEKAQREYELALGAATSERAVLKVKCGAALVKYLLLEVGEANGGELVGLATALARETAELGRRAAEAGAHDVASWATVNVDVMGRGVFVGWAPYEVL